MSARVWIVGVAALGLAGCYDSLVGGTCADGYVEVGGECTQVSLTGHGDAGELDARGDSRGSDTKNDGGAPDAVLADASPDAGSPDAMPDADPCAGIDLQTDPNDCGYCGHVCASGICSAGVCVGDTGGHIVLVGNDFTVRHAAAMRVVGNAVALGVHRPVTVGFWRGTASVSGAGANKTAVADGAAQLGLSWTGSDLTQLGGAQVDVIVIDSQLGSAAAAQQAGAAWTDAAQFVRNGGTVIAFGGENTVTEQVLSSAGLLDATIAAPATGSNLVVTAPTDAVAIGVSTPYHADTTTSAYHAGRGVVVVTDAAGDAVVIDAPAP